MVGKNEMRLGADAEPGGGHIDALRLERIHFLQEDVWIENDTVADEAEFFLVENTGGDGVQDGALTVHFDGMPGIVAALETHDDIAVRSQHVNDFSLSFVAPLGADNNGIGHIFTFFRFPGKAGKPVE